MSDALPAGSGAEPTSAAEQSSGPADSPLREPLFPQISLRFLFVLMVVAAAVLWTIRAAVIGGYLWAQCAVVVMGTAAGCFLVYALFFLLALAIAGPMVARSGASADPATAPGRAPTRRHATAEGPREDG